MKRTATKKKLPPVRVRRDPPTLEEAVFAAQGLTDDLDHQAVIAAELMGVSLEEAHVLVQRAASAPRRMAAPEVTFATSRSGEQRAVVVERKVERRSLSSMPRKPIVIERSSTSGGATVERKPFRSPSGGEVRTLLRLGRPSGR